MQLTTSLSMQQKHQNDDHGIKRPFRSVSETDTLDYFSKSHLVVPQIFHHIY
jgi:hypothetical protein